MDTVKMLTCLIRYTVKAPYRAIWISLRSDFLESMAQDGDESWQYITANMALQIQYSSNMAIVA